MPVEKLGDVEPRIDPTAYVHPSAVVIGDVWIGPASSIWPGAVLRGDFGPIRVGEMTSIQDNAVIHTSGEGTHIGSWCIVAHLAFVEEAVIEDACLVGVGARVLNGARMRTGSVAAAGAVVLPGVEVPSGSRAQGVPATIVAIANPSRAEIVAGAHEYAENARRFRTPFSPP